MIYMKSNNVPLQTYLRTVVFNYDFGKLSMEEQQRLASMKGRMVLTGDSSQTAAIRAAKAGARALIVMQANDPREPIHHANVGVVWGTPQVDQEQYFPYLPMVTITCESGLRLRKMIASGHAQAILTWS